MSKSHKKRYCVIDHANKQSDRLGTNPNRALQRRERARRELTSDGAVVVGAESTGRSTGDTD